MDISQWVSIVEDGVRSGKSISQITQACLPYMHEPNYKRSYNLVKKQYYKITRGNAGGYNIHKAKATVTPTAAEGVNSVTYKENGDAIFDGFISMLHGKEVLPDDVMRVCNAAPEHWVIVSWTCNVWQGQTKEGNDRNGKANLWQFKVVMRPKASNEISFGEIKAFFDKMLKGSAKPKHLPAVKQKPKTDSHKMLEINISDLHFAKLSWSPECGENYDYKIARDCFFQIIHEECDRLKSGDYEKVLFVWTNDFFNSDTMENTTTGGTQQNTDIRWQKMFLNGMSILVDAIEELQVYAPVETFYIASNHCRTTEWYGINYLYAWFRNNERVTVQISCKARYYIQYGINLIGFSHSSYEKKQNLPYLMSIEVPQMWAESKYREFHLAHIHCEKVEEKGGIIFRWLPSVTAADAWHYDSGYIGAAKRSYSFTWDRDIGLRGINVVNVHKKEEI